MKTSLTIAIFLTVSGIASAYTQAELAAESKKANNCFEKCWDETLSRHPVDESFYGMTTHSDQLEDLSEDKARADEKVWERQLADCLPPKQLALAHRPPALGLPMLCCWRCSSSALTFLTFKAPGSTAPSGTSTHRPPV